MMRCVPLWRNQPQFADRCRAKDLYLHRALLDVCLIALRRYQFMSSVKPSQSKTRRAVYTDSFQSILSYSPESERRQRMLDEFVNSNLRTAWISHQCSGIRSPLWRICIIHFIRIRFVKLLDRNIKWHSTDTNRFMTSYYELQPKRVILGRCTSMFPLVAMSLWVRD